MNAPRKLHHFWLSGPSSARFEVLPVASIDGSPVSYSATTPNKASDTPGGYAPSQGPWTYLGQGHINKRGKLAPHRGSQRRGRLADNDS